MRLVGSRLRQENVALYTTVSLHYLPKDGMVSRISPGLM